MDPETPLVVPEVNIEKINEHKGIIANPELFTIQMVAALKATYMIVMGFPVLSFPLIRPFLVLELKQLMKCLRQSKEVSGR